MGADARGARLDREPGEKAGNTVRVSAELQPPASFPSLTAPPAGPGYADALKQLRGALVDGQGRDYKAYRATLKPDYARVWRELAPVHLLIAATVAGLALAQPGLPLGGQLALVPLGATVLGALINYVVLFLHEGAHHGLHPDRATNDRLTYALIGIFIGAHVATYRANHFEHHRKLGEPGDTEHSYFEAPTPGFLIRSLTGVRTLTMALGQRYLLGARDPGPATAQAPKKPLPWSLLGGLAFHGAVVGGLLLAGAWAAAAAWVGAMGLVFPTLGSLRQILEHRDERADPQADYSQIPHGATSRIFKGGLFTAFFGGAGFDRHLLHHFEPAVSYTRLPELEAFLRDTPLAGYLETRTTSYGRTLRALMEDRT